MALPDWSPAARDNTARENAALRELVTVYRHLSGLALQDADLAGVVRLISERTAATVAVVTQLMDVLTAAALHVHPNTVAYRVKRIEELTGLRLDHYPDRLLAQVALEILTALGTQP